MPLGGNMEKIKLLLREPIRYIRENSYCLWLLYIPLYLMYFMGLQLREVPMDRIRILETSFDRMIPTVPLFFIPYGFWWVLFPGALAFFLFFGTRRDFLKLCFIMFGGYTICMVVYTFFPNGLELREPIVTEDILSRAVLWLRSIDPPRNVCPSMHVSSTVAIDIVVRQCDYIEPKFKNLETLIAVLICLATLFIKQHSIIDVILGILMSVLLWLIWEKFSENIESQKS